MKTTLFVVVLAAGVSRLLSAGEPTGTPIEEAIAKAQKGDPTPLRIGDFVPYARSELALIARIGEVTDPAGRRRLVNFVCALEGQALRDAKRPYDHSDNKGLLTAMARLALAEKDPDVCRAIASCLRGHFAPQALMDHKAAVQDLLEKTCAPEALALFTSIVDSSQKEEREKAISYAQKLHPRFQLSIGARWGGAADATSLFNALDKVEKSSSGEIEDWIEGASLADSEGVRVMLAERLHSERIIELTGGGSIPARNVYASILCRMLRGEKDFPVRKCGQDFSESELDSIEQWARQRLKVEYKGKRKPVSSRPGVSF